MTNEVNISLKEPPLFELQGSGVPAMLTVPEAARLLRISRTLAYELAGLGELPSVRFGRAIRVPRRALEDWIARVPPAEAEHRRRQRLPSS